MERCLIGIGSNLGNRKNYIENAIRSLGENGIKVRRVSKFYETKSAGGPSQGNYLNGVVEIETDLGPRRLLERLHRIEYSLGRVRSIKYGPRTIDLDILLYGNRRIDQNDLKIPHPRMWQRGFVIEPLRDLLPMKVIKNIKSLIKILNKEKKGKKIIGFVPTMGYLHEGHLSLMRQARIDTDVVVVSIYVNPKQFGPKEDYKIYPRDLKRDLKLCRAVGVDIVFSPDDREMYPEGYCTYVNLERLTDRLCGASRPAQFKGVATIVTKLFNIVRPDIAYFGQKDAQQATVIKRMVKDLNLPIKIKVMPIVREKDALAMSSRNIYLNPMERKDATVLYSALCKARQMIKTGERDAEKVKAVIKGIIKKVKYARIDYISIVDLENLDDVKKISGRVLIALAVWIGKTRLIDNIIVPCNINKVMITEIKK